MMLNFWMQLFIAAAIAAGGLTAVLFLRKAFRPVPVLLWTVALAGVIVLGARGFTYVSPDRDNGSPGGVDTIAQADFTARKLLVSGEDADSLRLLNDLQSLNAQSPQYVIDQARLQGMDGRYDRAALLYKKARMMCADGRYPFPDDEYELLAPLTSVYAWLESGLLPDTGAEAAISDPVMAAYIASQGLTPEDYGYAGQDEEAARRAREAYLFKVGQNLNKALSALKNEDEAYKRLEEAVDAAAIANKQYDSFVRTGAFDQDEAQKAARSFEKLRKEAPDALAGAYVRMAWLRLSGLTGQYENAGDLMDGYSSAGELMVLSELYMAGYTPPAVYEKKNLSADSALLGEVVRLCEKAYDRQAAEKSPRAARKIEEKMEAILLESENEALSELKDRLIDAADGAPEADESQLCFQLSKIEDYLGNEDQADLYLDRAFATAGLSDNAVYASSMMRLYGIIHGAEGSAINAAEISALVDQLFDNALPVGRFSPPSDPGMGSYGPVRLASQATNNEQRVAEFKSHLKEYVTKKSAVINIGEIDISAFPKITARVQVDLEFKDEDDIDLADFVDVFDCNVAISDFTFEELELDVARTLLLCDVSGSMSGSVGQLQDAVTQFAEDMGEDEEAAVYGFDDGMVFTNRFSDDPDVVRQAVSQLGAFGGTAIISALEQAMGTFRKDAKASNVVILMTDGQDNDPISTGEIYSRIGALASRNGVTVYVIGMGSVDGAYLQAIAGAGHGQLLYAEDSSSLASLYDFIHGQLTKQYELTFTAADTESYNRTLEVHLPAEDMTGRRAYSLGAPGQPGGDEDASLPDKADVTVSGLNEKRIYQKTGEQTVYLLGGGFASDTVVSALLSEKNTYRLTAEYVDGGRMKLTIPGGVAAGRYDLSVTVNGRTYSFPRELTVVAQGGQSQRLKFGAYEFDALSLEIEEGQIVMNGVTMNDWLEFIDVVILSGNFRMEGVDIIAERLTLTDGNGASVYFKPGARGLAGQQLSQHVPVVLAPMGSVELFGYAADAASYQTSPLQGSGVTLIPMMLRGGEARLYHDRFEMSGVQIDTRFEFMKELLQTAQGLKFEFEGRVDGVISKGGVGIKAKLKVENDYKNKDKYFNALGKLPVSIQSAELSLDTLKNEYAFSLGVDMKLWKLRSVGFELAWKDPFLNTPQSRVCLDKAIVKADARVQFTIGSIPATLSDFKVGLEDMTAKMTNADYNLLLDSYITGGFDLALGELKGLIPKLEDFIGDVYFVKLDDAEVSVRLREFNLKFKTGINVTDAFKLKDCEVQIGNFSYSNHLMGLNNEDVTGFYLKLGSSAKYERPNVKLSASGFVDFVACNKLTMLRMNGSLQAGVNWWLLNANFNASGDAMVGLLYNSKDKIQFTILVKGSAGGKNAGFRVDITNGSLLPSLNFY